MTSVPGPRLDDVQSGNRQGITGAAAIASTDIRLAAYLRFGLLDGRTAFDKARLDGGAAHIKGNGPLDTGFAGQGGSRQNTRGGPRLDQVNRPPPLVAVPHQPA